MADERIVTRRSPSARQPTERLKEECREARGVSLVEGAARDVSYAITILRKRPVLGVVAVLTLAPAIDANTAMFSVMDVMAGGTLTAA